MPQSGLLFLNDRDVSSEFSFVVSELTGWPGMLSGAPREVPLSDGPEMAGAMLDPRLIRRTSATATASGSIRTATPATALAAFDALRGTLGLGEVSVRTAYATDRYCLATCNGVEGSADAPQILNGDVAIRLSFVVKDGIAWRNQPDAYALSTTRVACPLGTADSRPIIVIHGGGVAMTNPTITVRNAAGDVVQSMTLTVSLGTTAAVRIDCARYTVSIITAGVISDALVLGAWPIGAGDFIVLRPYDGFPELAAYPSVELSSSTGTAQGDITYTRRFR